MSTLARTVEHILEPIIGGMAAESLVDGLAAAGYAVVPIVPTEKMRACGHDFGWHSGVDGIHAAEEEKVAALWEAMLEAAKEGR